MMAPKKVAVFLLCCFMLANPGTAQDLTQLPDEWMTAKGLLGWNQVLYHSTAAHPSRKPYTTIFYGNLNLNFFGKVNAPFSYSVGNTGNQFTQPTYNQSSFHPTYKWLTLHTGTISQNWSPYTLGGYVCKGIAADLNPGNWKISLLRGRFRKAVQADSSASGLAQWSYRRMGEGVKLGYGKGNMSVQVNAFHARDVADGMVIPEILRITPKENTCFGVQWQQRFGKFNVNADASESRFQHDIRLPQPVAVWHALKLGMQYQLGQLGLQAGWQWVDPGYQTLGAYYFANDMEHVTAGLSYRQKQGKFNISGNLGRQHDNLDHSKISRLSRTVAAVTGSVTLVKQWTANWSWNNFLSQTNLQPYAGDQLRNPYAAWDTLHLRQISQNLNLGLAGRLHSDSNHQTTLNMGVTVQDNTSSEGGRRQKGNRFVTGMAALGWLKPKTGRTASVGFSLTSVEAGEKQVYQWSPVAGYGTSLAGGKAGIRASVSATGSWYGGRISGKTASIRLGGNYSPARGHQLSLNLQCLWRQDKPLSNPQTPGRSYREWTLLLNYSIAGELWKLGRKGK